MRTALTVLMVALTAAPVAMAEHRCDVVANDASIKTPELTLQALVSPSTVVELDQRPLMFALHGFIEFKTLQELFAYVDAQAGRWQFPSERARKEFGDALLRRGVESRVVSMLSEKPFEILLTHTQEELAAEIGCLPASLFEGKKWKLERITYGQAFERVRARWSRGVNCWSSSSSIPGRVLSNWYPIEEGIELYGANYDSTEHFWQAVKYHPSVTVGDLLALLDRLDAVDWGPWLARLDRDQETYLANAYAIEFLRVNLTAAHRAWFREQLQALPRDAEARELQQRASGAVGRKARFSARFSAFQEKILWGDLADVFHLLVYLNQKVPLGDAALLNALNSRHFDGVYLGDRKLGFISPEFRAQMLEIWKVKFIKIKRFNQVIRSIPRDVRLEHFLNDGDSPDIPIPVYIGYLNEIRRQAWAAAPNKSVQ